MRLTIRELIELNNVFNEVNFQVTDFKIARKFAIISEELTRQVTLLQSMLRSTYQNDYFKYNEELNSLKCNFAQKDGLGNIVFNEVGDCCIKENERMEYELKVQQLGCKYKVAIDKYSEICNSYLNETVDFNIPLLTEKDIENLQLTARNLKVLSLIVGE